MSEHTEPSPQRSEPRFPFTAIVSQTTMKRALILNAVNTRIGGVLIRGKKGTAKSTAVRSLAALLPEVSVVRGCPYSCLPENRQGLCQWCQSHPNPPSEGEGILSQDAPAVTRQVRIVDLPVSATEDRLVGSLDIEQAIRAGSRSFEPGLIAATHRGILYVDEVNLLNDHLVDVLLDAAAMGRNYVEREGISVSHAAEFILVGTMNPEEGDLRPQLLDRFGLAVEVDSAFTAEERQEVVRRRIAYEADPFAFMDAWQESEAAERDRILRSQQLLPSVTVSDDILELITGICAEYQVDGLRADIVMYKTASTIAAYEGRDHVVADDVREAAEMALLHRQRRQPFQQPHLVTEQLDSMIDEFQNRPHDRETQDPENPQSEERDDGDPDPPEPEEHPPEPEGDSGPQDQHFEVGNPFSVRSFQVKPPDHRARPAGGRRARTVSGTPSGRYVGAAVPQEKATDLALDATLRAAAPHQPQRRRPHPNTLPEGEGTNRAGEGTDDEPAFLIEPHDVREKVRETKTGSLILFVVDASGSMGAQRRMVAVKGAILSLLLDAYQRRDRVGLIAFRGTGAQVLLPPTSSVDLAHTLLSEMPTGGRTPLSRGLLLAMEVIEAEKQKDRSVLPLLVVLSDGRANVAMGSTDASAGESSGTSLPVAEARAMAAAIREQRIPAVVIDTETDFLRLGLAEPIAEAMGAPCIKLEELHSDALVDTVRIQLPTTDNQPLSPDEVQALLQRIRLE